MAYDAGVCLWGVGGDAAPVFMLPGLQKRENMLMRDRRFLSEQRTICCVRATLFDSRVSLWVQRG